MASPRIILPLLALLIATPLAAGGTIEGVVTFPQKGGSEGRLRLRYAGQTGAKQQDEAPAPSPAVVFVEDVAGQWPAPADHPKMLQKGLAFVPRVLPLLVGTTVDFPNEDSLQHNVFSYSATKRFDLGRYRTGESRPVTFEQAGLVRVYCEIHAHMKGFILVLKNPFYALVGEDGAFRIEGLPAGKYKVTAWQEEHEPVVMEVEVKDGDPTKQDFQLAGPPARTAPVAVPGPSPCCASDDDVLAPPRMAIEPLPGTDPSRGGDGCRR